MFCEKFLAPFITKCDVDYLSFIVIIDLDLELRRPEYVNTVKA